MNVLKAKYLVYNLLLLPFLPTVSVPPSLPNRNSLNLRLSGNLFGKISSEVVVAVLVVVEGAEMFEAEEECELEWEVEVKFVEFTDKFVEFKTLL